MQSESLQQQSSAHGIVIRAAAERSRPVRFWAYVWADDEDTADDHWHQRVPQQRAA